MLNAKMFLPLCLLLFFWTAGCRSDREADPPLEQQIVNGLRPAAYLPGKAVTYTLEDRMRHWQAPAVSIAVIDDMDIRWRGAFGVLKEGEPTQVDIHTLFQAASVSKPVAAVATAHLAYQDVLSLDADINSLLEGWQLPYGEYTGKVTPGRILSHTAGLGVGGFEGYPSEDALPTLLQIIEGEEPANSPAVRIESRPGAGFQYSGGGYQVLQKALEDVTGRPFPEMMQDRIFNPLGMIRSGYAPLDSVQKANAAHGHELTGPIPHYAPIHVESAAGGLWTTPSDLAKLLIELMEAYHGRSDQILDSAAVRDLLRPRFWDYGLGFKVLGEGRDLRFSHGGATRGWHSHFLAFPERGQGVVVMTNGTNGWVLYPEIERAVASALGWPILEPDTLRPAALEPELLEAYTGRYRMNGLTVDIRRDTSHLTFAGAGLEWTLIPSRRDTFEIVDVKGQVFFKREDRRALTGLHLWFELPDWSPYRAWDFERVAGN